MWGSMPNQRQLPKWLPFKNIDHSDLTFDEHILGVYVHICTKCEISMFKHVRGVHRQQFQCQQQRRTTNKARLHKVPFPYFNPVHLFSFNIM